MINLEGKVAVVTGASRGIGAAVARRLADQGVKLGLASRSGDDLGIPDAVAMSTDVRDRAQVTALVEETVARHGGIDIVIANAGRRLLRSVRRARPGASRRDDGRQCQGRDHDRGGDRPPSDRPRRRRLRLGRVRGRPARVSRSRRSTAPPSSRRSDSRARSTTSFARRACAAPTSVPAGSRRTSRWRRATAAHPTCPSSPG